MKLYTSNYLSQSISIIDYQTLELEKEINLGPDIYPHHFCIEKDKNIMYIPSSFDGMLYVLDIEKEKIIDSVSVGGNLSQVCLCKNELFIANEDSNSIYVLNKTKLEPIGVISVDNMPHGFAYDQIDDKIYVPCIDSILCIDVEKKAVEKKINLDYKAWHIKIDKYKDLIYTSTLDGKIVILDKKNLKIVDIIGNLLIPVETCLNYKNECIYIADLGYKAIKILDYNTYKEIGCIKVNGNPQGLEISSDSKHLFITDTFNNSVKIYRTDENKLIGEIKVGKEPTTIVFV
ncbi:dehydrogenase [Paraclostridium ghonii]|uniref:DNA-binding beta-propeller fold protein YncE n=1 Tax=Paraclostridium ghonii TaxID=29358 RepID=A0ABU0N2Z6_9FIRM|nr:YncE family protein [Paeniclostridium ghonii]MDQ0557533.1 DNA-binding beta-propeller fold protein YncE [Paeniclostridium ghonii]